MQVRWAVPVVLGATGVALLAWAVASGGATLYLVVIFPILTGTSPALFGGVVLLLLALFLTPWALSFGGQAGALPPAPAIPGPGPQRPTVYGGGVILLGPIPIFFGSVRPGRRWVYLLAGVGGILLLVAVVLFFALGAP